MLAYLVIFFLFAFFGWIVDSFYSSLRRQKIIISGYFPGVPLCPIYGFGGILLVNSFIFLSSQPAWFSILLSTFLIICLEYNGGRLAEYLLDERLWDYSDEKINIDGYISASHSFLWLVGVSVLYYLFKNQEDKIMAFLVRGAFDKGLEVLLLFLLILGALWWTSKTKKFRLARLEGQHLQTIRSIEDIFDLKKWSKLTQQKRNELLRKISKNQIIKWLRN